MIENIPDKYIGYTGIQLCLATIPPVLNSPSNNKGKRGENKILGGGGYFSAHSIWNMIFLTLLNY